MPILTILKKILFPLFSLFLVYQSKALLKVLISIEPNQFGFLGNLLFTALIVLFVTGIFAFVGFAYPTNKLLPKNYYLIKKPAHIRWWYKFLGVKYFKVFLLMMFWGKPQNRKKYFNGTKQGLHNFVFQTKQSEFGHLLAFIMVLIFSLILLFHKHHQLVLLVTILNLIANFYPIILQRFHRIRIDTIVH
jgi:hypothetical protein